MQLKGQVIGGVIVLDGKMDLPEGTPVQIVPVVPEERRTIADKFRNVIGKATSLPEDMAAQHDHYLNRGARPQSEGSAETTIRRIERMRQKFGRG
jgi:hypothetical protein